MSRYAEIPTYAFVVDGDDNVFYGILVASEMAYVKIADVQHLTTTGSIETILSIAATGTGLENRIRNMFPSMTFHDIKKVIVCSRTMQLHMERVLHNYSVRA